MSTDTGARPPAPVAGAGEPDTRRDQRRRRAVALLVPVLLVAVAGTLRLYRLAEPPEIYFDETYYVTDARSLLAVGTEEEFAVHPPLGKWLIAAGIAVLGDNPVGWRAPGALAGSVTVLLTYLAGLRLFGRRGVAALAALLLAVDGLAFTMSRIAMLDAFLALFVVAGFWLLLADHDRRWDAAPGPGDGLPRLRCPHRWLAGVVLGLALATKWSALLAIGAAGLFVAASELAWRRRVTGSPWTRVWAPALSVAGALVVVPVAVYVASYAGWFMNFTETRVGRQACPVAAECDAGTVDIARAWVGEQREIQRFHGALEAPHRYRSPASEWLWLRRPVAYHYASCTPQDSGCAIPPGTVAHIVGLGNPVLWWLALLAYPALVWFGVRHRDWRAGALLAFLAGQYLPWLLARRPLFLFYLAPVVPFVALAVGWCAVRLAERRGLRWVPWALAVAAVAAFAFFYPVYAAYPLDPHAWRQRMWFDSWI
ncbi:MAG TPA: phospholipid carrier-dependent glycosyltransferase [Egibacteraceae bacterium]|nr:phospholipid carrier-dependent glycosyltransferase [Egibacteraceae bacterium]